MYSIRMNHDFENESGLLNESETEETKVMFASTGPNLADASTITKNWPSLNGTNHTTVSPSQWASGL
jgi:hypothetical protein